MICSLTLAECDIAAAVAELLSRMPVLAIRFGTMHCAYLSITIKSRCFGYSGGERCTAELAVTKVKRFFLLKVEAILHSLHCTVIHCVCPN